MSAKEDCGVDAREETGSVSACASALGTTMREWTVLLSWRKSLGRAKSKEAM